MIAIASSHSQALLVLLQNIMLSLESGVNFILGLLHEMTTVKQQVMSVYHL